MKYFFVVQVGPRKDEEANGEEEETLEQWRLAKMEKEKWMQVKSSEERKPILNLYFTLFTLIWTNKVGSQGSLRSMDVS